MSRRLLLLLCLILGCPAAPLKRPSGKPPTETTHDPFRSLPVSAERLELEVDAGRSVGRVSRRLFGTNMEPHLDVVPESESGCPRRLEIW